MATWISRIRQGDWAFRALLFVAIFLLAVQLPHVACDATCDLGGEMGYDYARNHYQVGVDVLHIVGPYGYLQFPNAYSGWVVSQKRAFGILFGVIFSCAVILALRYFSSRLVRIAWLLAIIPVAIPAHPDAGADALYYLFFLLAPPPAHTETLLLPTFGMRSFCALQLFSH